MRKAGDGRGGFTPKGNGVGESTLAGMPCVMPSGVGETTEAGISWLRIWACDDCRANTKKVNTNIRRNICHLPADPPGPLLSLNQYDNPRRSKATLSFPPSFSAPST